MKVMGIDVCDYSDGTIPFLIYDGVRLLFPNKSFDVVFLAFILVQIFDSKQSETKRKIFLVSLLAGLMGLVLSASRASWIVAALVSSLAVVLLKH